MHVFHSDHPAAPILGTPIQAEFIDAIPRATSGKILRLELRDRERNR